VLVHNSVDVVNLDRYVRMNVRLDVELHHAQLHFSLIGSEKQNPVEAVTSVKSDDVVVESSALVEVLGSRGVRSRRGRGVHRCAGSD
jgi:hypothetical protein